MEKHIQTGIGAVLIAICLWLGSTVVEMQVSVATLTEQVMNLNRGMDAVAASNLQMLAVASIAPA